MWVEKVNKALSPGTTRGYAEAWLRHNNIEYSWGETDQINGIARVGAVYGLSKKDIGITLQFDEGGQRVESLNVKPVYTGF